MALPTGSRVADRFAIEAVAGSGGMGTVWRAHDGKLGREVYAKLKKGG